MVLQILTDWQIYGRSYIEASELSSRTNTREHEKLGRAVSAGREDDFTFHLQRFFLATPEYRYGGGAGPVQQHLEYQCPGDHVEIRALPRWVKIRISSAAALSISLRKLKVSYAYLRGAVKVLVVRMAGLLRRLDEALAEWMYVTGILHVHRPGPAMKTPFPSFVAFSLDEIGQHLPVRPA